MASTGTSIVSVLSLPLVTVISPGRSGAGDGAVPDTTPSGDTDSQGEPDNFVNPVGGAEPFHNPDSACCTWPPGGTDAVV